jgi:HAD superfamily hydrolase (TIGR01509 family)
VIDALVFDFDGLILDTETPEYESWCQVYREHGAELALDVWLQCIGGGPELFDPYAHLAQACGQVVDPETIRRKRRPGYEMIVHNQPLLPGVETLLTAARERGLKLAVASSSSHAWVVGHLERRGLLPFFHAVKTADDVARVKPAPDLYLAATAALGVAPQRAVAFEDSANGARAAKAAGLYCIAVPNPMTRHLDLSHADLILDSLERLALDELANHLRLEH